MRLVICADGTWNSPHVGSLAEGFSTNVVKFASAVRPRDPVGQPQVVCYHTGVGSLGGWWSRLTGGPSHLQNGPGLPGRLCLARGPHPFHGGLGYGGGFGHSGDASALLDQTRL